MSCEQNNHHITYEERNKLIDFIINVLGLSPPNGRRNTPHSKKFVEMFRWIEIGIERYGNADKPKDMDRIDYWIQRFIEAHDF